MFENQGPHKHVVPIKQIGVSTARIRMG